MKISVISFTEKGEKLSVKLKRELEKESDLRADLFSKCRGEEKSTDSADPKICRVEDSLEDWVGGQFAERRPVLFIGACGIAVRSIAPHLRSKLTDSPVLVMDEGGRFVIPLVSGHIGGAIALAETIARCMGAEAVITTATDSNGCFAVDLFAKRNQLQILKKEGIKAVSGKLLKGDEVSVCVEGMDAGKLPDGLRFCAYPPAKPADIVISEDPEALLYARCPLKPKEYAVGIGCKKGKGEADLERFFLGQLSHLGLTYEDVFSLASVDRKRTEEGILSLAEKYRIPYDTFSAEQLNAVCGEFHGSEFVRDTAGVDNVCERAAILACGEGGELILEKQACDGMTIAVARRQWNAAGLNWNAGVEV